MSGLKLCDFAGSDSWKFFEILEIDSDFMIEPAVNWKDNPVYSETAALLQKMQVKNDAAERGVKLGHSFLERAKIEKNFQNVLQVVENSRKKRPNQRSNKVNDENWFLKL